MTAEISEDRMHKQNVFLIQVFIINAEHTLSSAIYRLYNKCSTYQVAIHFAGDRLQTADVGC